VTHASVSIRRGASCTCDRARQFVSQPWPDADWRRLRHAAAGRGIRRRAGAASRIACATQTRDRREPWPITENCDWRVPIRPGAKQDDSFVTAAREYPMGNVCGQTWRRAEPARHAETTALSMILLSVRWYVAYPLSLRNLEDAKSAPCRSTHHRRQTTSARL
jgi:hypothetical protein